MSEEEVCKVKATNSLEKEKVSGESSDEEEDDHDPQFEPLVDLKTLPIIDMKTLEQDEEVLWEHRGQLYRFDDSEPPGEWKQRGTGVVKLLKHKVHGYVRLLMRRDIVLKVCANHYVLPDLALRQHGKSDRCWVWCTPADFSDDEPKVETLAIRFKDADICQDFHAHFEEAKTLMREYQKKVLLSSEEEQQEAPSKAGDGADTAKGADEGAAELVKNVEALSVS